MCLLSAFAKRVVPFRSFRVAFFFPVVEELVFRGALVWWFCHNILDVGFMATFWWTFCAFFVGHLRDIVESARKGDFLRFLDPIIIGCFNTALLVHAILVQVASPLLAIAACIFAHAIYNTLIEYLLKPLLPWLLIWLRVAGMIMALGAYWIIFTLVGTQNLWPW